MDIDPKAWGRWIWGDRPIFKIVVEGFTLVTALLFVLSLVTNSFIFAQAGLSFVQIASPSDVLMSGFALLYRSALAVTIGAALIITSRSRIARLMALGLSFAIQTATILLTSPIDERFIYSTDSWYGSIAVAVTLIMGGMILIYSVRRGDTAQARFDEIMQANGFDPHDDNYYMHSARDDDSALRGPDPLSALREPGRADAAAALVLMAAERGVQCRLKSDLDALGYYVDHPRPPDELIVDHAHPMTWVALLVVVCGSLSALLQGGLGYMSAYSYLVSPMTCAPNAVFWVGERSLVVICREGDRNYPMVLKDAQDIRISTHLRYLHSQRSKQTSR